jgi:DNA-binding LytR/AlgR family response regulator
MGIIALRFPLNMSLPLHCIIVEDEPIAAEILADYVKQTDFLELDHICDNALSAREYVRDHQVDVMFLDINMPKLTGLEFLRTLSKPPKVIITTAYDQYGVEGFDLQVVDYLLKPIEEDRFQKAVNKLLLPVHLVQTVSATGPEVEYVRPFHFFTVSKRSVKIYLDEIFYIESLKDSVAIHTTAKSYNTNYQLGELESLIKSDNFLRVHRSFLIAIDKITSFSAAEIEIGERVIPIGRSHKDYVLSRLEKRT